MSLIVLLSSSKIFLDSLSLKRWFSFQIHSTNEGLQGSFVSRWRAINVVLLLVEWRMFVFRITYQEYSSDIICRICYFCYICYFWYLCHLFMLFVRFISPVFLLNDFVESAECEVQSISFLCFPCHWLCAEVVRSVVEKRSRGQKSSGSESGETIYLCHSRPGALDAQKRRFM